MNCLPSLLHRFSSHFAIAALALPFSVILPASTCFADIKYNLNNYSDEQNGGELTGHITVIDSAAADGFLDTSEVVNWRFTLSHPSLPALTVDSLTSTNPLLTMSGSPLSIDSNYISMPATQFIFQDNIFVMANYALDMSGYEGLIDWRRSILGVSESYIARNGMGTPSIADDDVYWVHSTISGDPPLNLGGRDPWIIATVAAVPEPSSLVLISMAFAFLPFIRSRSNQATKHI